MGGGDVQRQSSLPAREALNQVNIQCNSQPYNSRLFTSFMVDLRVNINIVLIITSPPARDSTPADLFIAVRYAH